MQRFLANRTIILAFQTMRNIIKIKKYIIMKKQLPILLLFSFIFSFHAHSQRVEFAFDTAGNRISRTIILPAPMSETRSIQVEYEPELETEPFVEQQGEREIRIFPNPTRGMLAVEIRGGETNDAVRLSLFDMQGRLLQTIESSAGVIQQVDMSAYPPGTYVLQLQIENQTMSYRIIRQ